MVKSGQTIMLRLPKEAAAIPVTPYVFSGQQNGQEKIPWTDAKTDDKTVLLYLTPHVALSPEGIDALHPEPSTKPAEKGSPP